MDRKAASTVGREFEDAVRELAARHGLDVGSVRVTYGDGLTLKVRLDEVRMAKNGVNAGTAHARFFETMKGRDWPVGDNWGLTRELELGDEVVVGGKTLYFAGVAARSTKRPIVLQDAEGRVYKSGRIPAITRVLW